MKLMYSNSASLVGATVLSALVLAGCERPPMDSVQRGYRGLGMEAVVNPRLLEDQLEANVLPAAMPRVEGGGPKASEVYQNVHILGDLDVGNFTRLMTAITSWVAPEQGCNYCHVGDDFASDDVYTKRVARVMLAMTQRTNEDWKSHVGETGVTCYTCHRGQPVPEAVWATDPGPAHAKGLAPAQQNIAAESVAYASLPYDPLTPFLQEDNEIRVISDVALPEGSRKSIKQTEWTYGLMMHFSDALGVNCTHCHNSRSFFAWDQSPPERTTAWYGIRLVREMNNDFIDSTTDILPASRKGPLGDPLKVNCTTCHLGAYRPLYGQQMLADYPSLATLSGKAKEATVATAPVPEAPSGK
jgi:photosynthetic reaction center cytochrome c subunit